MNQACKQYDSKELCQLFKHTRSSYYYQTKDKPVSNNTSTMIKSIQQIALETGHIYGKRRMQIALKSQGYDIGFYQLTTLINKTNIIAIPPENAIITIHNKGRKPAKS